MPLALQSVNGIHVAALSGALDNSSGVDLVTGIKASVEKGASIILDCTLVSNMDVAGFKHLLALHRWSQVGNGRLVLAGMSPDAWALIVENHCENTFESSPSVPAAFQALGVSSEPASGAAAPSGYEDYPEPPAFPSDPPASAADDPYGQSFGTPEADPWNQTLPDNPVPPAYSAAASWDTPAATDKEDDPWAQFEDGTPQAKNKNQAGGSGKKSKLPLFIGIAVLLLLLVGGGLWFKDSLKVPVIEVSESSLEVQEGKEPRPVEITVTHGELDIDAIELPAGMTLVEDTISDEPGAQRIYSFYGTPKPGAESMDVQLTASKEKGSDRRAEPVRLAIEILPKPMEWQLSQAPVLLKVGTPVPYQPIITGAKAVTFSPASDMPEGLVIQANAKDAEKWLLAGNPVTAGKFKLEFTAQPKKGALESRSLQIEVEPPPPPPPTVEPVVVTPAPDAPVTPGTVTPPGMTLEPGAAPSAAAVLSEAEKAEKAKLDDAMRIFLLERIEKANDHFSFTEKLQLRQMVELLTDARLVARVTFPTGKITLLEREKRVLKEAMDNEANRKLLEDPDCQILVVGYASPTGPPALNIRLSRGRAATVNDMLRNVLGRGADLCGDYGPTDIVSEDQLGNQAVEVFAGIIHLSSDLEAVADKFKEDFNARHGGR